MARKARDAIDEDDETAIITIGTPTYAGVGATAAHTVTITDDDPQPTIDFNSGSFTVGEGDGAGTLTLRLRDPSMSLTTSGKTVTVYYTTADITASLKKMRPPGVKISACNGKKAPPESTR